MFTITKLRSGPVKSNSYCRSALVYHFHFTRRQQIWLWCLTQPRPLLFTGQIIEYICILANNRRLHSSKDINSEIGKNSMQNAPSPFRRSWRWQNLACICPWQPQALSPSHSRLASSQSVDSTITRCTAYPPRSHNLCFCRNPPWQTDSDRSDMTATGLTIECTCRTYQEMPTVWICALPCQLIELLFMS